MKALGTFDFNGVSKKAGDFVSKDEQEKIGKADVEKLFKLNLVEKPEAVGKAEEKKPQGK